MFYKQQSVVVVEAGVLLSKIQFPDGEETYVRTENLTESSKRAYKTQPVKSAYALYEGNEAIFDAPFVAPAKDFVALALLDAHVIKYGQLVVSSGPESLAKAHGELEWAGIRNAEGFVRTSPNGHDVKYDLFIPDPKVPDIDKALGIFLNPHRLNSTGLYQISRKDYIVRLLDKVHILAIEETLNPAQ